MLHDLSRWEELRDQPRMAHGERLPSPVSKALLENQPIAVVTIVASSPSTHSAHRTPPHLIAALQGRSC